MMGKVNKNKRIGIITKILTENPNTLFTLNYFAEILNSAKSTLSEDIDIIQEIFNEYDLGCIESVSGASGGILYKPKMNKEQIIQVSNEICNLLKDKNRIILGGYLYMNDIFYNPSMAYKIGVALANP